MKHSNTMFFDSSRWQIIKSTIIALIASLICVILFALILNFAALPQNVIMPVSQVIKILSIFIGCLLGIKSKTMGWLKGAAIGLLFIVLSFFLFALLNGKIEINVNLIFDILVGVASGIIAGILTVNLKK